MEVKNFTMVYLIIFLLFTTTVSLYSEKDTSQKKIIKIAGYGPFYGVYVDQIPVPVFSFSDFALAVIVEFLGKYYEEDNQTIARVIVRNFFLQKIAHGQLEIGKSFLKKFNQTKPIQEWLKKRSSIASCANFGAYLLIRRFNIKRFKDANLITQINNIIGL